MILLLHDSVVEQNVFLGKPLFHKYVFYGLILRIWNEQREESEDTCHTVTITMMAQK